MAPDLFYNSERWRDDEMPTSTRFPPPPLSPTAHDTGAISELLVKVVRLGCSFIKAKAAEHKGEGG